jgi:hypothetical protein
MLPGRSWLTKQFDASTAQFLDGRRKVTDREPYDRPGIKVLPTLVSGPDLDIPAIGGSVQARFGVPASAPHVLVEIH